MAAEYLLRMFGGLQLVCHDEKVSKFATKRCALILARLAVEPDHRISRDELIEFLWPDVYADVARQRLRQELRRLRESTGDFGRSIRADRQWIELEPDSLTTDIHAFDQTLAAAERATSASAKVILLREAVGMLRGPFLAGYSDPWLVALRRDYEERGRRAWLSLADQLEAIGQADDALAATINAVRQDPLNANANQALIQRLADQGQDARARQAFHEFDALMFRQFGKHAPDSLRASGSVSIAERPSVKPSRPARLFGRDELLVQIETVLSREGACVVLVGPFGIGKRHLLREVVWRVAQSSPLPIQTDHEISGSKDGLVVLDEQLDRDALARRIADAKAKGWRVIARSRVRLGLDEVTEIAVPPLPIPSSNEPSDQAFECPSVQLLLSERGDRFVEDAPYAQRCEVIELARQADGMPFQLRLFANRLRLESPAEVLRSATDNPDPKLQAYVAEALKNLAVAPRDGLIALAFLDGVSIPLAAELVKTSDPSTVWRLLESRGLVVVEDRGSIRRLRVPRPIADAVRQIAGESKLASTYSSLADFAYETSRHLTGPRQDSAFSLLESELENLKNALTWSIAYNPPLAARLVIGMWRTICARGNSAGDGELLLAGAESADGHVDDEHIGMAFAGAAIALNIGGKLERCEAAYLRAIEAFERGALADYLAWVNMNYACLLLKTDPMRGVAFAKTSAERCKHEADRTVASATYAFGLAITGEHAEAVRVAEQVFERRLTSTDVATRARAYGELAEIYAMVGRTEAAKPLLAEGIAQLRQVGIQDWLIEALISAARLADPIDDVDEMLTEAEGIAARMGSTMKQIEIARVRVRRAFSIGDKSQSMSAIERLFHFTRLADLRSELDESLVLLADELARANFNAHANAIRASQGRLVSGPSLPGWEALLSTESPSTRCVLAVALAKEALA